MRAGHGKNVGRAIDQLRSQRLAAQAANVHTFSQKGGDRMQTGRLTADCIDPGGSDFNVLAIAEKAAKKPFRHRASADVSGTNEEDAFHILGRARARSENLKLNLSKSTRAASACRTL